ncbi:MAG: mechanosensitive ion channel [Gammaproteobacteria bacterium]
MSFFEKYLPKEMSQELLLSWAVSISTAILVFVIGRFIVQMIIKVLRHALVKSKMDQLLVDFISSIAQAVLLLFVIIASLEQLGLDTTSLVALLGAAGIAVGLALKDSLQNFSSGVMLIIFRPFKTGDFIDAGGVMGSVEHIGIFTTNLKTPDNKQVIVPNGQIYSGVITNYSAKPTRRVDMTVGISYGSDLKKAKDIINDMLKQDKRILPDPAPVVAVGALNSSSVDLIVRPWVNSADYWNVLWEFNENIKQAFDAAGIEIPFPQMSLHLHKQD